MNGFTEESEFTTIDLNQFAIIESMEHEDDGETGILLPDYKVKMEV